MELHSNMHWQHLSTQYDELSYCFDGLPHESSSTIFASSKRISKLGWLANYKQWVQILYEEGFSFLRRYFYNISKPKKGPSLVNYKIDRHLSENYRRIYFIFQPGNQKCHWTLAKWHDEMTLDEGVVLEFTILGFIHKQYPQLGGSKSGQNCQRIVLKNCWHGGGGYQKSGKNADIVYGWSHISQWFNFVEIKNCSLGRLVLKGWWSMFTWTEKGILFMGYS